MLVYSQSMENINEETLKSMRTVIAIENGKLGGQTTKRKYGRDYYVALNKKSIEAKKKRKEQNEAIDSGTVGASELTAE